MWGFRVGIFGEAGKHVWETKTLPNNQMIIEQR